MRLPFAAVLLLFACALARAETPLERGRYLVEGIAGCGNCHTPRDANGPLSGKTLAGNALVEDNPAFRAIAPNITQDRETGIGAWTDAQIARAIREGIRPNGLLIGPPMPFELYRQLGDEDLAAMVAYLRTVPAVSNGSEPSTYRIPLPTSYGPPVEHVSAPPRGDQVGYGAYLAGPVGHCMACHTPLKDGRNDAARVGAGGITFKNPWGTYVSTNLTPTGLGNWTDAEIERALREGISKDGHHLSRPMGYPYYAKVSGEDMRALIAYLRSLAPL